MSGAADPPSRWPLLRDALAGFPDSQQQLGEAMADRIRSEVPFYGDADGDAPADLAKITAAHLRNAADRLHENDPDDVPYSIGLARGEAGVPLATVLAAYRVGIQFLWERIALHTEQRGGRSAADLVRLGSEIWLLYDEYARAMEQGWHDARQAQLLRSHQERGSLVDSILRSTGGPPSRLWEAVDRLGLPRRGGYVVVVVHAERPGADPLAEIERHLLAHRIASAWLLRADLLAGVVAVSAQDSEDVLLAELVRAGVTAGISPRRTDYAAGAQAFRFAAAAAAASDPGTTTRFGAQPVAVTAAASPDIAHEMASEVLAAVLALPDEESAALLATLRAWFAEGGSTADTAKALFLHPNTVRNRLHRVEALTGCTLTAPADIAEVAIALAGLKLP